MIVDNRGLVDWGFMSIGEGKARSGCSNVFVNLYFLRLLFPFSFFYQLYHRDACISCFLSLVFFFYISFY